jgi:hypothetical protein
MLLRDVEGDEEGLVAPVHGQVNSSSYDSDYEAYTTAKSYTSSPGYSSGNDAQWANAGSPSSSYSDAGSISTDMSGISIRSSSQPSSRPSGYSDYPNEYPSQVQYAQPASVSSTTNSTATTSSSATSGSVSSSSLHHPSHVLPPSLSSSSSSSVSQHQGSRQSHSHHMQARSAPAFQSDFDHNQLGHVSSSLSSALSQTGHPIPIPPHSAQPHQQQFNVAPIHPAHPQLSHSQLSSIGSPYSVHIPLSSSPPMKGMNTYNGYASSLSSGSAASSVSGSPPMSTINSSYGQQQHHGHPSHSSNIGPVRRHRSMTPSLMRSELDGTTATALGINGRPLTASSIGSSGEFALMQQQAQQHQQAQHRDRSSAEREHHRGRGYHPYAGGYNSRSTSVSTSGRSSPVGYGASMSLANGSTSSLISNGGNTGGAPVSGSMDGSTVRRMVRMDLDRDRSESMPASSGPTAVRSSSNSSSLYGAQTLPPNPPQPDFVGNIQGMYRTESPLPYDGQAIHQHRLGTAGSVGMFVMDVDPTVEQPGMSLQQSQYQQHQHQQIPHQHHQPQHQQAHYGDSGVRMNGYYDTQQRVAAMM